VKIVEVDTRTRRIRRIIAEVYDEDAARFLCNRLNGWLLRDLSCVYELRRI
jgi:hypothetical protein